ncbi:MAG: hypothetical protein H5T81_00050 [Tetrasphaera sp.]|nr:hypothetical protein [Tetrasphaera sp.]
MSITPSTLTRIAGVCAVTAGAIFIAVQINHPPLDVEHIQTTGMALRETAKAVMAALALVGIAGMYLHQVRRAGILGLVGYVVLSIGYLAMFAVQCIAGFVLPTVAASDPAFVQTVLDEAAGGPASGQIGHLHELLLISGIGYAVGGLLLGVALFRARVLTRWACALMAVATTSVLALPALPESFSRPFAVPMGLALIGLGVSLARSAGAELSSEADAAATVVPQSIASTPAAAVEQSMSSSRTTSPQTPTSSQDTTERPAERVTIP